MSDNDLRTRIAWDTLVAGRAAEAEAYLQSINAPISIDPYTLFIYSFAAIQSGHIERAIPVAERLRIKFPAFIPGREVHAFLILKSAATREDALVRYIDLAGERTAGRHLKKLVSKIRNIKEFVSFQKTISVSDCIPLKKYSPERFAERIPKNRTIRYRRVGIPKQFVVVSAIMIATIIVGTILYSNSSEIIKTFSSHTEKELSPVDRVDISSEKYAIIDKHPQKNAKYLYSDESSLRADFTQARTMIKEGSCNDALLILNKIVLSNAQLKIRDSAVFLVSYIGGLDDRKSSDIPLNLIIAQPELYKGIMVSWSSRIIHTEKKGAGTTLTGVVTDAKGADQGIAEFFYNGDAGFAEGETAKIDGVFYQLIGKNKRPYIEVRNLVKHR